MSLISNILLVVLVLIAIIEMYLSNQSIKGKYSTSKSDKNRKMLFGAIKRHWKKSLIIIGIAVAVLLMKIGSNMGNKSSFSAILDYVAIGIFVVSLIFIVVDSLRFRKEIKSII